MTFFLCPIRADFSAWGSDASGLQARQYLYKTRKELATQHLTKLAFSEALRYFVMLQDNLGVSSALNALIKHCESQLSNSIIQPGDALNHLKSCLHTYSMIDRELIDASNICSITVDKLL